MIYDSSSKTSRKLEAGLLRARVFVPIFEPVYAYRGTTKICGVNRHRRIEARVGCDNSE